MALLFPAGYQFFDLNGDPLASGTINFYVSGTTTDKAVYSNPALSASLSNPYSLNSAGRLAVNVYGSGNYTVLVKDSTGSTVFSRDDVFGWNEIGDLSGSGGSALVGFIHSAAGAVERTVQSKLRDFVDGADFGMVGDASTNNTTAFNNALAAAVAAGHRRLWIPAGNYRFNSKPNDIETTVEIIGDSMSNTVLERNYNASGSSGFIVIKANGVVLKNLSINAISGTTNGSAVQIMATSSLATSFCVLENLSLSTYGTDTWDYTLLIDGSLKSTGTLATRDHQINNVHVFGAAIKAVYIDSAIGLQWDGGGIYTAGGTDGGITITGDSSNKSNYVRINIPVVNGGVSFSDCNYCTVTTSVVGGAIENADSANYCSVAGYITGAVQNNWGSSGVFRPQKLYGSSTYDPASLGDGQRAETDVTVTGAALGDFAQASFSLDTQGIILNAQVTATNTVTVTFHNETGGTIDLGSGTIRVQVEKPQA